MPSLCTCNHLKNCSISENHYLKFLQSLNVHVLGQSCGCCTQVVALTGSNQPRRPEALSVCVAEKALGHGLLFILERKFPNTMLSISRCVSAIYLRSETPGGSVLRCLPSKAPHAKQPALFRTVRVSPWSRRCSPLRIMARPFNNSIVQPPCAEHCAKVEP